MTVNLVFQLNLMLTSKHSFIIHKKVVNFTLPPTWVATNFACVYLAVLFLLILVLLQKDSL